MNHAPIRIGTSSWYNSNAPGPSAPEHARLTYADLWDRYKQTLVEQGKQKEEISNHRTALNGFQTAHQQTDSSRVGPELDGDFIQGLTRYVEAQQTAGVKSSTYNPRKSHLKALHKIYRELTAPSRLPETFPTRLEYLILDKYVSIGDFHYRAASDLCSLATIRCWCNGSKQPLKDSVETLEEFERILKVSTGTLTSLLPRRLYGSGSRPTCDTNYGKKVSIAHSKPYAVWNDSLEAEWVLLKEHKSTAILPEGKSRLKGAVWSDNSIGTMPTATKVKQNLGHFFGYCCLPKDHEDPQLRGYGLSKEKLTLALVADKKLVEDYLGFQKLRAGGKYNNGATTALSLFMSLIRPETGYLYQHPEVARRLDKRLTVTAWRQRCRETHERFGTITTGIKALRDEGDSRFAKGRDPEEPIAEILAMKRPLEPILEGIKAALAEVPAAHHKKKNNIHLAAHYRDTLLLALMAANPLRLQQFSAMEFGKHLVQDLNGEWWLQFKKHEFKNRRSLSSDYRVRVSPNVWPLIEYYRDIFRPLLAGADVCDYVFRPEQTNKKGSDPTGRIPRGTIHRAFHRISYHYVPHCHSFGPHAIRHIVATDIIKRDPRIGFFLASKVLHDKLETVERAYAHLNQNDFFEPYNDHFNERWLRVMREEKSRDNEVAA